MIYVFAGFGIAILAVILFFTGRSLRVREEQFCERKLRTMAEVLSISSGNPSTAFSLMVRLPVLEDRQIYTCAAGRIKTADYPVGRMVEVEYAPVKLLSLRSVEIRLVENPPLDRRRLGKALDIFATALLAIAVCFVTTGITKML